MSPHRESDPASWNEDAVHLGHRFGGRPPDAPETGDDVERSVVPRQGAHVSDSQVGSGLRSRATSTRRADASMPAQRAPRSAGQLNREARSAGDVEQRSPAPMPSRWCRATYSRQLVGSLRVAKSTALRPQPSSTTAPCSRRPGR